MGSEEVTAWRSGLSLAEQLHIIRQRHIGCDVTFTVGPNQETVVAHKIVLVAASQLFEDMFYGPQPVTDNVINMDDVDPGTFKVIIEYLYTNKAAVNIENAGELLVAAKRFQVESLAVECLQFLSINLKPTNVFSVLESAVRVNEENLSRRCAAFILKKSRDVLESSQFTSLSHEALLKVVQCDHTEGYTEKEIYKACLQWATAQCNRLDKEPNDQNIRSVLGDVVYDIRFCTMSAVEFGELMGARNVLTADEQSEIFKYIILANSTKNLAFLGNSQFNKAPRGCIAEMADTIVVHRFDGLDPNFLYYDYSCDYADAIDFSCEVAARLVGAGLYGGKWPGENDVQVQLLSMTGEVLADTGYVLMTSNGASDPKEMYFPAPVPIEANQRYTLHAVLSIKHSYETYNGTRGSQKVSCEGFNVTFYNSNYKRDWNETNVWEGQVPSLIFLAN